MKKYSCIVIFMWILFRLANTGFAQERPETYSFDRTSHDFGVLKAGQAADTVFTLTNTGETPLILLDVTVSCHCVKIKWPREPIPVGHSAELSMTYKDRQAGAFYKVVDVITNGTPRRTQLRLKGSIEK